MKGKNHPRQMVDREYRDILQAALDAGWRFTISGRGHPKITKPDGTYSMPLPGSGGGYGDLRKSIICKLRKHGLDL